MIVALEAEIYGPQDGSGGGGGAAEGGGRRVVSLDT